MTTTGVQLRATPTADLSPAQLGRLRAFLTNAFDGGFGDHDWAAALGGVHVLATAGGELAGHGSVVVRELTAGERPLRTGYVEAVATAPERRRQGIGWAVMAEVERLVTEGFELGALSSSRQAVGLYAARGWWRWSGPVAAHTPDGVVDSPGEVIFVLPTRRTPRELDVTDRLVCDRRAGDPW